MPYDQNHVSSELYRVMPPPKNSSQLREALDAAHGKWPEPEPENVAPEVREPRHRLGGARSISIWLGGLITATLAVILGTLIATWAIRAF
jgi:hypothetical protein